MIGRLSIIITCSKIISAMILSRIRNAYDRIIMNCQFGFRANRSTTDAIFFLQNSINMSSQPLFLCFKDCKAVYDWINRDVFFKILEMRLQSQVIQSILHRNTSSN